MSRRNGEFNFLKEYSLSELAAQFNCMEEMMRFVLAGEHRKGLVSVNNHHYRILGKAKPHILSVFQHTAKSGLSPVSIVRNVTIERATNIVAEKLQMEPGDQVYRQERTRMVNGEVLANQCNFIPYEVCPGLEDHRMKVTKGLYPAAENPDLLLRDHKPDKTYHL